METNIIGVKYEDKYEPRVFDGKEYSYFTDKKVNIGDLVEAPTKFGTSIAKVIRINIPEGEIKNIIPYMKKINRKINKNRYLNFAEILEDVA